KQNRFGKHQKYSKVDVARLDWTCNNERCSVFKTWYILDPRLIKYCKSALAKPNAQLFIKTLCMNNIKENNKFNMNEYAVIEVVAVQRSHTHIKGAKGGIRTNVVEELKNL